MSKSPKRKASGGPKRKPVTIDMEAEKKPAAGTKPAASKNTTRSTPRVGRDAGKPAPAPKPTKNEQPKAEAKVEPNSEPKQQPKEQGKPASNTNTSSSGVGRIAAGIIGGAVALGGGAAAQYAGFLPSFGTQPVSGFATETALKEANQGLQSRLANLQSQLDTLKNTPQTPAGPDMAQVQNAIDKSIDAARQSSDSNDTLEQIAAVEQRATRLETKLSETQTKLVELSTAAANKEPDPQVSALSDRVDIVAGNLATLKQDVTSELSKEGVDPVAVTALGATVAGITTKLSTIDTKIADVTSRTEALPSDVASAQIVDEKIAATKSAVDASVADLKHQIGTMSQTIASQSETIASLEAQLANGADKRAARALIAAQLKSDVDRGLPFGNALETFRTSTGESDAYAEIEPYSASGLPTLDALAATFNESIAKKIIDATTPVKEMSLTDRLLSGAKSLVEVQPIGAVEGDGVDAILSRIRASLANNDGAAASAAWATLPQEGQVVSSDWHASLQARVQANNLLNSSVSKFISSTVSN